jgi:hypothetical protein
MGDDTLENLLYQTRNNPSKLSRTRPEWASLQAELVSHRNLTLMLLWQEYPEPVGEKPTHFRWNTHLGWHKR